MPRAGDKFTNTVVEPDEVLTAEEFAERRPKPTGRDARLPSAEEPPNVALGGLAGEFIARLFGAHPAVGRTVGTVAVRALDPKVQAAVKQKWSAAEATIRGGVKELAGKVRAQLRGKR